MPGKVAIKEIIKLCLPVLMQRYWYFTAYVALFFTMPLLNAAMEKIPRRLFEISFGILLFLLTVCQQTVIVENTFGTNSGYSYLWLIVLYCVGAYLGKYEVRFQKSTKASLIYISCVGICWIAQFAMKRLAIGSPERLEGYNSPFIFLMGVMLVVLFADMKVPARLGKIVTFLAPASFGVYLIHLHPLVQNHILMDAFVGLGDIPGWALLPVAILLTVGVYLVCSGIDLLRHYLFKLCKVKTLLSRLEHKFIPDNGGN